MHPVRSRSSRKPRPHILALAAQLAWAGPALLAVDAQAQSQGASAALVQAKVPAGPLGEALSRFALQAGVLLTVDAEKVRDKHSAGLTGTVTVEDGFRRLLAGSGYQLGRNPAGYVLQKTPPAPAATAAASAVLRPSAPAASDDATLTTVLPVVTVTSNRLGDITEGSGSYTAGSIATATRMVLTPRETPQSISVITRQKMDDFNLTTIDQVMEHTPGVSIVTYDSERTEYYARGFAIQNFQYDGIPMTRDSSYSAGNTLSDMVIYDRVEVLKGATGLLTGSGTPGATINLIRKKPTREFRGHATLGADNWGSYRAEIDAGSALNDSGSIRARGVISYHDKQTQADHYQRRSEVLYGIVEADLSPSTLLTIGADYQNNKPKGSSWGGNPLLNSDGAFNDRPRSFNNGAEWSHWDQYTRTGFATIEHAFDNDWVLKAQFNHQINGYDANLGSAASGFPDPSDGSGVSIWAGQYIGRTTSDALDVYASGRFQLSGRKHEMVAGGSLAKRRWTNSSWWNDASYDYSVSDYYSWDGKVAAPAWGATPDATNDETTRESGLYSAARWNLDDRVKLITGGRWSNYRNRVQGMDESGVFTPYLGVAADLNRDYSLYASYTGIFSPQSYQDEQGRTLDPLQGKNYEIGAKAALLGGRLNASAAVFQLLQDNYAIESGGTTPSGGTAYRAAQGVKTQGYELEISGQVSPGWQLQAGYSHSVSRQDGERVSTLTPATQFSLHSSHKLEGGLAGLTVGGGLRWQDKTWGTISTPSGDSVVHTVSGYWLADAMARYEFSQQLSASLSVSNLFDKKYYTIFSWYSTYTWGAGRTVNLSASYRF